jgi:hypothetical protein
MSKKVKVVASPAATDLLVQAINCSTEDAAVLVVEKVLDLIYPKPDYLAGRERWCQEDEEAVLDLIRSINPKDTVESLLTAQFVGLHLKGMAVMANDNYNIMGQGMMMLRLSQQALETLQRYRGKGQVINVNYNVLNQGNAILNTVIKGGSKEKNGA